MREDANFINNYKFNVFYLKNNASQDESIEKLEINKQTVLDWRVYVDLIISSHLKILSKKLMSI